MDICLLQIQDKWKPMIGPREGSWPVECGRFWVFGDSKIGVESETISIGGAWIWPKCPARYRYIRAPRPSFHCDSGNDKVKLLCKWIANWYFEFILQSNPAKLHSSMKSSSWCPMAILCTCEKRFKFTFLDFLQLTHLRELHVQGEKLSLFHQSWFFSFTVHFWAASKVGYWS